jgi:hypothetical protein
MSGASYRRRGITYLPGLSKPLARNRNRRGSIVRAADNTRLPCAAYLALSLTLVNNIGEQPHRLGFK